MKKPSTCRSCPLYVRGTGFVKPEICKGVPEMIFIGEAPGLTEVATGKPFVGASGDWFRHRILHSAGVDPKKIVIDNTLRCLLDNDSGNYPEGPMKVEAEKCCRRYDVLQRWPKVPIVLMGARAASQFFGREITMKKFHGDIREVNGRLVTTTFHPAMVMRKPNHLPVVIQEIYNARIVRPEQLVPPRVLKTVPFKFKPKADFIVNDLEWNEKGNITAFGLASNPKNAIATFNAKAGANELRRMLRQYKRLKIAGHAFITSDRVKLAEIGLNIPLKRIFDTLVGMHTVYPHMAQLGLLDLGSCVRFYFPTTDWKQQAIWRRTKKQQAEALDKGETYDLLQYCGQDCSYNFPLAAALIRDIGATNQWHIYERTARLAELTAEMKQVGIRVDRDELFKFAKKRLKERTNEKASFKYSGVGGPINPDSRDQVIPWAKTEFGIKLPNIEKDTINRFYGEHPEFDRWVDYREGTKSVESWFPIEYDKAKKKIVSIADRIYPQHHATGTTVDRTSTSDPGFQNLPRSSETRVIVRRGKLIQVPNRLLEFRRFILPENEDEMLWVFDYKQIENRTLAWEAGCKKMLREFSSGKDFHRLFASRMFEKAPNLVDKGERDFSKTVVHGTGYVETNYGLSLRLYGNRKAESLARAAWFQNIYKKEYPEIPAFHERIGRMVEAGDELTNAFGRKRTIYASSFHEGQKEGCHYICCSDAAGIIIDAAIKIRDELKKRPIMIVHDELVFSLPRGARGERLGRDIKEIMELPVKAMDNLVFPISCKVGENYFNLCERDLDKRRR